MSSTNLQMLEAGRVVRQFSYEAMHEEGESSAAQSHRENLLVSYPEIIGDLDTAIAETTEPTAREELRKGKFILEMLAEDTSRRAELEFERMIGNVKE